MSTHFNSTTNERERPTSCEGLCLVCTPQEPLHALNQSSSDMVNSVAPELRWGDRSDLIYMLATLAPMLGKALPKGLSGNDALRLAGCDLVNVSDSDNPDGRKDVTRATLGVGRAAVGVDTIFESADGKLLLTGVKILL